MQPRNVSIKNTFLFLVLLVFSSCSTLKNTKRSTTEKEETKQLEIAEIKNVIIAKVRMAALGCPFYLEAYENGIGVRMYPINLDPSLQRDGVKIEFTYVVSKAQSPENCRAEKVVVLNDVKQVF
jgi:type IV pilus biogenesis protein CpaD/CtpE